MRLTRGVVPFAVVLAVAAGAACGDDDKGKEKTAADLKPNQVLLKVPGMH